MHARSLRDDGTYAASRNLTGYARRDQVVWYVAPEIKEAAVARALKEIRGHGYLRVRHLEDRHSFLQLLIIKK